MLKCIAEKEQIAAGEALTSASHAFLLFRIDSLFISFFLRAVLRIGENKEALAFWNDRAMSLFPPGD